MRITGIMTTATLCLALVATAACNRKDDVYTERGGSVETGESIRVADVELGKRVGADKKIMDATDSFTPRDTIYASVRTSGAATGAKLNARWTFEDGSVVNEQTETISPTGGDAYTEFHISKGSAWPAGKYKVTILLNGKEVDSEDFTVKQ